MCPLLTWGLELTSLPCPGPPVENSDMGHLGMLRFFLPGSHKGWEISVFSGVETSWEEEGKRKPVSDSPPGTSSL